ncbi:MAG: O-antigen ligase family protein [Chloroflexi bacterium]|uniref:O-antigen ligase family protein n=1 Tax=Candidatus Flexifilum breve TaxID=3140694 RepID=UPI0031370C3F|nr:O-antigen ligase family protein [Chloroflexota bacterium]
MRLSRLAFVFAAVYFTLIGGSVYYFQIFGVRVLHHAVVTVLLGVWLLRRMRRGLPTTPLNPLIGALIGVWALSAFFSLDPRSAFENLWFPLSHVVLFFIIADLIGRGRESLLMETFFLVTALIAVLALAQLMAWYTGIDLIPEPGVGWLNVGLLIPPETPMIYIPLGVSTWMAGFAAPTMIVALGWAFSSTKRSYRVVFFGIAGMLLLVLIGTFSRGGFLGAGAGLAVLIGLRLLRAVLPAQSTPAIKRPQFARLLPVLGLAVVILAAVIGLIVWIGRSEARASGDDLRFGLWGGAASMIAADPLTGVGPGLFGRAYREIRSPVNVDDRLSTAHNAYLNNAAETGLPGVLVMIGFGVVIALRWWSLWRRADTPTRQRRLEGAGAALIALGIQSVFDTFTYTPLVLLSLVLIIYCTVEPGSLLTVTPPRWNRVGAGALAAVISVYGLAFIQFDRAHAQFNASVRGNDLDAARQAAEIDPHLHLYQLQIAYLTSTIPAYEQALTLEPTWETGWLNLAGLREQAGDISGALDAAWQARELRYANTGAFNWARIGDANNAAPDADILLNYQMVTYAEVPLSDFWMQTERRRAAIAELMRADSYALDLRYRVATTFDPDYAVSLVNPTPTSAMQWWIVGQHELTVQGDPSRAAHAFTQAIERDRGNGDYYVSRARAEVSVEPAAAQRDLDIADMRPTCQELPNAVRLALVESPEVLNRLRAVAVPGRIIEQNFEGVLFQGRVASIELLPSMRLPGPPTEVLQPWYDLAAAYEANGQPDAALNVYRAILDLAPYEQLASEGINRLS